MKQIKKMPLSCRNMFWPFGKAQRRKREVRKLLEKLILDHADKLECLLFLLQNNKQSTYISTDILDDKISVLKISYKTGTEYLIHYFIKAMEESHLKHVFYTILSQSQCFPTQNH